MKKTYEPPEIEIVLFEDSVICGRADIMSESDIGGGYEEWGFRPIENEDDM